DVETNKAESRELGLNAGQMLGLGASSEATSACNAYILLNIEPELDCYDAHRALETMNHAYFVVVLSSYKGNIPDYADVVLPITPFSLTSSTFINTDGSIQSFHGVVSAIGETRPAGKVLRVMGNMLQLKGFDYDSSEHLRAEVISNEQGFIRSRDNSLVALSP